MEYQQDELKLIIARLIKDVQYEGISDAALFKACENLNLSNSFCKFQNGIYTALEYIAEDFNELMKTELQNYDLKKMRINERVKLAVRMRLSNYAKLPNYRTFLRNVLLFSAKPKNICFSNKILYSTVDAVWYNIHDKSTDFNYYTKRATLAGVYLSTLLFFANDYSMDFQFTLLFLDKSISSVIMFHKLKTYIRTTIGFQSNKA